MFENLVEKLKKSNTTLVFTEGPDPRILEAASRLKKEGILEPLLVGNPDEVKAAAEKGGFDITDIRIVDPANYRRMDDPPSLYSADGLTLLAVTDKNKIATPVWKVQAQRLENLFV